MKDGAEVIVVGCGVVGLTCAIRLLEKFSVKIIAHKIPPHTTSDVAGAFWEPYKALPMERVLSWAKTSLDRFYELAETPETGVSITQSMEAFPVLTEPPWWMDIPRQSRVALAPELPPGYACGFIFTVPKMETPIYMPYLLDRFRKAGGVLEAVEQPLLISQLYKEYRLIVNCTGLGARDFCNDPRVYPLRGQILKVKAPGVTSISVSDGPTYLMPRRDDCILGGTAQANDWNLEADAETAADILLRCQKLAPALGDCQILEHKVGLRPGRDEVRLEFETVSEQCAVIHNYGHGGAGFTLSWGCAEDVLALATTFAQKLETSDSLQ